MILLVLLDLYILIYIDLYILYIYIYKTYIAKTSQKCDEAKVEQWIKKILKDAPDREKGSRKKRKRANRDFIITK